MSHPCWNKVTWSGSPEDQLAVYNLMRTEESDFDFNTVIPYPDHFAKLDAERARLVTEGVKWEELPKDGFNSGGWQWCIDHWGTKWNASEVYGDVGYVIFSTAYSSPKPVISALSRMYPSLTFALYWLNRTDEYSGWCRFREGAQVDEGVLNEENGNDLPGWSSGPLVRF